MKMNVQLLSVFIVCCTASNTMFAAEMYQNITTAVALVLVATPFQESVSQALPNECIPCDPKSLAKLMFGSSSKSLSFQEPQHTPSKALVTASHYNITKPQPRRNAAYSQRKLGNGTCRPRGYQRGNYNNGKPRAISKY